MPGRGLSRRLVRLGNKEIAGIAEGAGPRKAGQADCVFAELGKRRARCDRAPTGKDGERFLASLGKTVGGADGPGGFGCGLQRVL